jgi:hypothetical protein
MFDHRLRSRVGRAILVQTRSVRQSLFRLKDAGESLTGAVEYDTIQTPAFKIHGSRPRTSSDSSVQLRIDTDRRVVTVRPESIHLR